MNKILLPLLMVIFSNPSFSQNSGSVNGKVTDKQTNEALPGATVSIKGTLTSTVTNYEGNFIIKTSKIGTIVLEVSYVGYETVELIVTVTGGGTTKADASLSTDERVGNSVVVSASKRPEKITNAPASIQIIGSKDLEQFAGSNASELVSKVQGIEYTRSGVDGMTFNARGYNSAFNNKVVQLVDGRNCMAALSGGVPVFNNGVYIKDDIERLEIVLGPQTALYGPNAHNALFNTITKDARKYQGTTVSVSGGSHYQFSARLRQATKINNKLAYKLIGEYVTGKEFVFYDSVYLNPNAPSLSIPERNVNFDFRHIRGEAKLYYSILPKTDIVLSGGGSTNNVLSVTTGGRNQMRDVTYSFLQAQLVHPNYFVNIYNTWGSLGNSYPIATYTRTYWLRTHPPNPLPPDSAELVAMLSKFKERSQRLNAEVQYNYEFENVGLFLVTGLTYQNEKPNGFGITLVDSFERIRIKQYGGVVQLEKLLPWGLRFIGTTRFDHHSNFGNFFAPRFALMKAIGNGNFRITWGKAYSMPSILNQFAGINRSLFGNGKGIKYIRSGARFSDPASVSFTIPLKPEEVNAWEFGYKGTIAKKLFIDINYYNSSSKNFISPTRTQFGRVLAVGDIEVIHSQPTAGFVDSNDTLRNASFSTFFNYAEVRSYGIDIGLSYSFSKFVSAAVKYSWFGSDITKDNLKNDANKDGYVSLEEKTLNAPKNRGVIILNFKNLCKEKLFINLSARFVEQYDFYSASQIGTEAGRGSRGKVYALVNDQPRYYFKNFDWGPLGGFTTVDLSAGYKFNELVSVNMGISNLFDTRQIEFVGSPSIGRLIMFELKVHVPNRQKK